MRLHVLQISAARPAAKLCWQRGMPSASFRQFLPDCGYVPMLSVLRLSLREFRDR